jgi:proline dehydrogenase
VASAHSAFHRHHGRVLGIAQRERGLHVAHLRRSGEFGDKVLQCVEIGRDAFEFQMLYGIRRDLQEQLIQQGYRLRVYVPYGQAWYSYLMRRMAERPANLFFVLRNLIRG